MKLRWCFFGIGILAFVIATLGATEDETAPSALKSWGISLADVHGGRLRPIVLPGTEQHLNYFWYWTFTFRAETNLAVLEEYLGQMQKRLYDRDAGREADFIGENMARIKRTLADAKKVTPKISLITESDQAILDTGNVLVRNLVERQLRQKFHTCREISRLDLSQIPETVDPELGRGRWVRGIATFSGVPQNSRKMQIRINGMGSGNLPSLVPGKLLTPDFLDLRTTFRPALRKVFVFDYRRIGNSGQPTLDPINFSGKQIDWEWLWPLQIYCGRYREFTVERVSGLKRRYVYCPYYIWNNTGATQKINILQAGLQQRINWGGERLFVRIYDDGKAAERWKSQVLDEINRRQTSGDELSFIEEHEAFPIQYEGLDLEAYYKNELELDYIPDDREVVSDPAAFKRLLAGDTKLAKIKSDLRKLKTDDNERKAKFAPANLASRLFHGEITEGKISSGVFITEWAVNNLPQVVSRLIAQLRAKALTGVSAGAEMTLYKAYLAMPGAKPGHGHAPPLEYDIQQMLATQARQALAAAGLELSDYALQRYGVLAPIGELLNQLAWQALEKRAAEKGITDAYFKVIVNDTPDQTTIMSQFRRLLPKERAPMMTYADKYSSLGEPGEMTTPSQGLPGSQDEAGDDAQVEEDDVW